MTSTPRKSIDPEFIADLHCPICGRDQLAIKSLANYPDFISCASCESQFAVEQEGDRIMYGKIPAAYPRTRRFALQQWAWPEAIARRAAEERPDSGEPVDLSAREAPTSEVPAAPETTVDPTKTDLPSPADLDAEEVLEDQPPSPPESALQEQTLREELLAADEAEAVDVPLVDEPEPAFPEPEADEGPPAPEDPQAEEMAEKAGPTISPEEGEEAHVLGDRTLDEGADFPVADRSMDEEYPPQASELLDDQPTEEEELSALDDLFEDQVEEAPTELADHEIEDESLSEEFPADFADEFDEPSQTELPADWSEAETEAEPTTELPEEDFSFFEQATESETPEAWDDSDDAAEGIFTPPFGEGESEDTDDFPEDFEPAPPMPDWLGAEGDEPSEAEDDEDMAAIDFTSLRDEPTDQTEDTSFGEEEDLLASLWGDDEESPAEQDEPTDFEDELAGFAGLGAIGEDFGEDEAAAEAFDESAADVWADKLEAESDEPLTVLQREGEPPAEVDDGPELSPEEEIARRQWAGDRAEKEPDPAKVAIEEEAEKARAGEVSFEAEEPAPGQRFRVVLQDHQAQFPNELCAHCSQSPTVSKLSTTASVYRGAGVGDRQVVTYRLPVCADCRDRAKARSDERQTAQLQAHLISVLVAMILVVTALAFRLVDFQERIGFDLAILFLLAGMGYAIPVAFLLIRASRIGKPADAKFVESTLRVPGDTEGAETAFEFRNMRYAHHFLQLNEKKALSDVNKVRERQYEQD